MRHIFFAVLLSSFLFAACTAKREPAEPLPPAVSEAANVSGIEVLLVEDVSGRTMEIELFEGGPLTREQKLEYMPDGNAPSSVNIFLIKTAGKTYMADAGFGNAVKEGKIDASKIDGVLLTHGHGDHVSGLLKEGGAANFSAPVFISKLESDYWLNPETKNADLQKNIAAVYGDGYRTFSYGDTLAPGITALDASGHTPGHTLFLIDTPNRKTLIVGDLLHAAALQFPHPEECAKYDMDRAKSVEIRKKWLQTAADNNWLIAGMHIPAPGIGSVKNNGAGGFEFVPAEPKNTQK